MEIMLKKIEGYVFNIYLYHVSLKAFITNLEVVITISTDSLPTTYRQITNRAWAQTNYRGWLCLQGSTAFDVSTGNGVYTMVPDVLSVTIPY